MHTHQTRVKKIIFCMYTVDSEVFSVRTLSCYSHMEQDYEYQISKIFITLNIQHINEQNFHGNIYPQNFLHKIFDYHVELLSQEIFLLQQLLESTCMVCTFCLCDKEQKFSVCTVY